MVKKAFMKTVEILLVIIITTLFMTIVIPGESEQTISKQKEYLGKLENNPDFRAFVTGNTGCFGPSEMIYVQDYLSNQFDYRLCIDAKAVDLPDTDVFVDTLFYAGNITNIDYKIVRLYYWSKNL